MCCDEFFDAFLEGVGISLSIFLWLFLSTLMVFLIGMSIIHCLLLFVMSLLLLIF